MVPRIDDAPSRILASSKISWSISCDQARNRTHTTGIVSVSLVMIFLAVVGKVITMRSTGVSQRHTVDSRKDYVRPATPRDPVFLDHERHYSYKRRGRYRISQTARVLSDFRGIHKLNKVVCSKHL